MLTCTEVDVVICCSWNQGSRECSDAATFCSCSDGVEYPVWSSGGPWFLRAATRPVGSGTESGLFRNANSLPEPLNALCHMWIGILASCEVVSQVNTTIRADPLLARAWGREQFHEQSIIARMLDACTPQQVYQMRSALESLFRWLGQAHRHDHQNGPLRVDIDLTGLPVSRRAEGSTKGHFGGRRSTYGRELVRIGATCITLGLLEKVECCAVILPYWCNAAARS